MAPPTITREPLVGPTSWAGKRPGAARTQRRMAIKNLETPFMVDSFFPGSRMYTKISYT
jgi:hypothetical protein